MYRKIILCAGLLTILFTIVSCSEKPQQTGEKAQDESTPNDQAAHDEGEAPHDETPSPDEGDEAAHDDDPERKEAASQSTALTSAPEKQQINGWLRWRGPMQSGVSLETDLPDSIEASDARWTFAMNGRGAPVMANGRVYFMAYEGDGPDLEEVLLCLDEQTGKIIWERRFSDFLSDVIYNRYSITSPSIDPESGNIFCMTAPGLLNCFSPDGDLIWQQPFIEKFGRFTYPNGRTVGPLIDDDLVIIHTMTSNWGPQGPARDRFFAFDKDSGDHVWTSTPGGPPKDSPYSYPVFEWRNGKRLLYAGTAGGNMVCLNVRTGEPVWRYQMSIGGVCASPLLYGDQLIAVHGKENLDTSSAGRMISLNLGAEPAPGNAGPLVLDSGSEAWRNNDLTSFTSSPVLVGNRIYNTIFTGELCCVDADTGELLWSVRLAPDQIHASPLYADGKLYVPMNNGSFYVIRPSDDGAEILSKTQLDGNCLAAPTVWNGNIYVHTTTTLYCFGDGSGTWSGIPATELRPTPGPAASLQIMPAEVLIQPGQSVDFRVRSIDANGLIVNESLESLSWADNTLGVDFSDNGLRATAGSTKPGATVLVAESGGLKGSVRFRIVYPDAFEEDFESIALTTPDRGNPDVKFGRPPSFWMGGWPKWDVRVVDGSKVLAKTISNPIFQRVMGFIGHPDQSNYTTRMDIMSEGNRRTMSTAGIVNQRYVILLKGNHRQLEIQSNVDRIKHTVPFRMKPGVWYTLVTRVDMGSDGSATIRAKAWPRDEAEPEAWTAEFTHQNGHTHGAPGLYGFAPQSRYRVYIDNLSVTPNE
ncbi:MAG: PQQ-binding-like beta-propeller repeat protein [Planctomycetes bacterium]|nr:PQQ-binding-like beta-propeller repeat protein [Planctomycetota bacterium]